MHIIGELDHYCFRWAGMQEEILRMNWNIDTLKKNEKQLENRIEKMRQKIDMKEKMLRETERDLELEKEEHTFTQATVKVRNQ